MTANKEKAAEERETIVRKPVNLELLEHLSKSSFNRDSDADSDSGESKKK